MKKTPKLLFIFLAILLLGCIFALMSCDNSTAEEGFSYTLTEGGAAYEVSGMGTANASHIVIPSTYNDLPVTSIGALAFSSEEIKTVTIPDSVITIDESAFSGCKNLKEVKLGASSKLETIKDQAFYNCTELKIINIPPCIEHVGYDAFYNCYSLECNDYGDAEYLGNEINPYSVLLHAVGYDITSYEVNPNTRVIYYKAFSGRTLLKNLTIPSSITYIGLDAFNACSSLIYNEYKGGRYLGNADNPHLVYCGSSSTNEPENEPREINESTRILYSGIKGESITIPSNIISITSFAFSHFPTKHITFESGSKLKRIDDSVFYHCINLERIRIPKSVKSIEEKAFFQCYNLESITFEESSQLKSIYDNAFLECRKLEGITIPASTTYVSSGAFFQCENLSYIEVDAGNPIYVVIGNCLIDNTSKTLVLGCENSVIPKDIGITSIAPCAFYNGYKNDDIYAIPSSVTTIGKWAFYGSEITIVIPSSVTSMGARAFRDNSTVFCEAASQPSGWSSNWGPADHDYVVWNFKEFYTDTQGTYYIFKNDSTAILYNFNRAEETFEIPSTVNGFSVTGIGKYAFWDCSSLTSITIPESVTSIGQSAFGYCESLTSVTIPNSVTNIGAYAFVESGNLQYNEQNNGLYLGNNSNPYLVFATTKNKEITSLEINSKTKFILDEAFSECINLNSVIIPSSVISIGQSAFFLCSNLTTITIPSSVTSIGPGTFGHCESLISVTIPNSVTSIGQDAFFNCSSLKTITIPSSVTSMDSSVFNTYGYLTIYCEASSKPDGWDSEWHSSKHVVWGHKPE